MLTLTDVKNIGLYGMLHTGEITWQRYLEKFDDNGTLDHNYISNISSHQRVQLWYKGYYGLSISEKSEYDNFMSTV